MFKKNPKPQKEETKKKAGNPKVKKALLITLIVLLVVLLLAITIPGALFIRYYNMLNVSKKNPTGTIDYEESATPLVTADPNDPDNPYNPNNPNHPEYTGTETLPPEPPVSGSPESSATVPKPPVVDPSGDLLKEKGIINVLLIGADYETRYGNSDAIIVVSINNVDKRLTLTSIMRDTAVYFPGKQNGQTVTWHDKISNAHAYGGPQLLINAIEANFGIKIDNYAEVHYEEFLKVFEAIGGIDVVMTEEEIRAFNHESGESFPTSSAGKPISLNAVQTLVYARMRHLSGSDFMRTYRHRNVLMAAFNKVKTMSVGQLDNLLTTLLPIVETDLSIGDCLSYAAGVANYSKYKVETFRIPVDGYYTYENNNLSIRGNNKTITMNLWRDQVAGTR